MKFRTPISQAKGLGSAKEGAHHWWMQRLTALALVPLAIWFTFSVASRVGAGYDAMYQWISSPWVAAFLLLFFIVSYYHGAIGVQVVLEDYVSAEGTRMLIIIAVKFILALLGTASAIAVIRIAATG
jgi:succinate dehydrogenase / fumarate reductase membrane anchor subunit